MEEFLKKNITIFIITFTTVLFLLLTAVFILFAYQKKIAFVDNSIIMDNYKGTIAVHDKMKENLSGAEEKADVLKKEIDDLKSKLIEQSDRLNNQEIAQFKKAINEKETEYNNFISEINNQLSALEKEAMNPIIKEINEKINKFGHNHNYDIIFGAASYGNIVYSKKVLNITPQVIKYLNDEYSKNNKEE